MPAPVRDPDKMFVMRVVGAVRLLAVAFAIVAGSESRQALAQAPGPIIVGPPSATQDEPIDVRLERVANIKPAAAREFFAALRRGLASSAKADVCKLVAYPLKQPSAVVNNAAECEQRYDTIFTIPVRRAVGRALFDEIFVAPTDLIINYGEVWMTPCKDACGTPGNLRITQVNHPDDGTLKPPSGKLLLSCVLAGPTEGQWLRLTADGTGGVDMKLYPNEAFPNPNKMPPTLSAKGTPVTSKFPECAFRIWSFTGSPITYSVVSTLSCIDQANDVVPPMGSIGQMTRVSAAKGTETVWCIE